MKKTEDLETERGIEGGAAAFAAQTQFAERLQARPLPAFVKSAQITQQLIFAALATPMG